LDNLKGDKVKYVYLFPQQLVFSQRRTDICGDLHVDV